MCLNVGPLVYIHVPNAQLNAIMKVFFVGSPILIFLRMLISYCAYKVTDLIYRKKKYLYAFLEINNVISCF